jgi:hypothetical protein
MFVTTPASWAGTSASAKSRKTTDFTSKGRAFVAVSAAAGGANTIIEEITRLRRAGTHIAVKKDG